jgi:beta-galactosidase
MNPSNKPHINPKFPKLWHGGDYSPEQWPQETWKDDVRLMQLSRFTVATMGMFAWSKLEPAEGEYEFDWLDEVIEGLTRADRWFILATPSAAPPAWLSKKYPETLRTGSDGVRRRHGNRVNFNLGSSLYLSKVREINQRLAERYGSHPRLLAWHLSNEYNGEDYGQESVEQFRDWLRAKFDYDLDALNRAYWTAFWGHTYRAWDEIEPPGGPYGETAIQGLTVDWKRFVSDQTLAFMLRESEPLREISPEIPITTNMMGTYPGLDYRKFAKHLDFISWDSYPAEKQSLEDPEVWRTVSFKHDLMRSLKPDRPWLLMEYTPSSANWYQVMQLKRPGIHRFESMHALAQGADGLQYFQWRQSRGGYEQFHGGVVSHSGAENTRVFNEVKEVGLLLDSLPELPGTLIKPKVALLYDWENKWAIDAACGPVQGDKGYEQACIDHYKALNKAGFAVDIVGMDDDLDAYRLLVAPMAYSLRPGFIARLHDFVKAGGTLFTTYLSGWVDENSLIFEGGFLTPLRDLLGIWSEELDVLRPGETNSIEILEGSALDLSARYQLHDFCELIHTDGAEVLGIFKQEFYAGRPAMTLNRFGLGKALYLAARPEQSLLDALLPQLARAAGVKAVLDTALPEGISVQKRESHDREFLFVLNANPYPVSFNAGGWGEIDLTPMDGTILTKVRELQEDRR